MMFKKLSLFFILLAGLFVVRFLVHPVHFADYDSYYNIVSELPGITVESPYEWLSYSTFAFASNFFEDPASALFYLYINNAIIFSLLFFLAVVNFKIDTGGLLFAFSLFAPLLFFITLRATPAYMFILLSVLCAPQNKIRSLTYSVIALFFHISAILPLLITLLVVFFPDFLRKILPVLSRTVHVISFVHIVVFFMGVSLMPSWLADVFIGYEFIEKYKSYADVSVTYSLNHYLHLIFSLVIFALVKRWRSHFSDFLLSYFHLSMLVYVLMMISPITAYRMSIFFLLPLILLMPWRHIFRNFKIAAYFLISPFLIVMSFNGILVL